MSLTRYVCMTLILLSTACGSSDVPTGTDPGFDPVFTLEVAPNPIIAQPSTDPAFQWEIGFDVVLAETNGVNLSINFFDLSVSERGSQTEVFRQNIGADTIIANRGSNLLQGGSSASTSFEAIRFTLPGGGREAFITVDVQVQDDRGRIFTDSRFFPIE